MKAKRFLFLVMAICLASGVKAQFYDSADDIYYYIQVDDKGEFKLNYATSCFIFNFDGKNACILNYQGNDMTYTPNQIKEKLSQNPNYLMDRLETGIYDVSYISKNRYKKEGKWEMNDRLLGYRHGTFSWTFNFSSDRNQMYLTYVSHDAVSTSEPSTYNLKYKRVDKSFFKVGRSRTPSNTLHE